MPHWQQIETKAKWAGSAQICQLRLRREAYRLLTTAGLDVGVLAFHRWPFSLLLLPSTRALEILAEVAAQFVKKELMTTPTRTISAVANKVNSEPSHLTLI